MEPLWTDAGKGQLISEEFSFAPKNEIKYFCTSTLPYKKRSNQRSSVKELK